MTGTNQPVLRTKRRLPTGRAVLGGLLVTLAVLGVLLASRIGDDGTFRDVVVAREDLAPGTVIAPEHVAQIRMRLAGDANWVIAEPEDVYGSVLLGPVGRLEFLQTANVAEGNPSAVPSGLAEVSIEIDPGRAPSTLAPGELISVLATYDDRDEPRTELVADRVVVLSYSNGEGDFSTSSTVLRLGLDDGEAASEIVTASLTGDISIIGITGAAGIEIPLVTRQ
ncbi:MAG: hypothetical protein ACI81L_001202 [Verrucomicrobiales bacterium]|jgi:hypothetical protein